MNNDTLFLKICSTSCLDGERTYEYFGDKSKLKGKIKKIYFTDNGNQKSLIRHCLPKSNVPSQFKTPGLKTPRDFDIYSSCANCTIVQKSGEEEDSFKIHLI